MSAQQEQIQTSPEGKVMEAPSEKVEKQDDVAESAPKQKAKTPKWKRAFREKTWDHRAGTISLVREIQRVLRGDDEYAREYPRFTINAIRERVYKNCRRFTEGSVTLVPSWHTYDGEISPDSSPLEYAIGDLEEVLEHMYQIGLINIDNHPGEDSEEEEGEEDESEESEEKVLWYSLPNAGFYVVNRWKE